MNKIKELRKEKNITVAELAKELGISQSMLTNYENGNGTPRDESIWEKLSQIFGVSKSHVMGLTTDIETANKTKQLKVVVDTSQPISIQPKNQTDLDVLIKLDLIDSEDMEEVSEFLDKLLAQEKYEGRRESNVKLIFKVDVLPCKTTGFTDAKSCIICNLNRQDRRWIFLFQILDKSLIILM